MLSPLTVSVEGPATVSVNGDNAGYVNSVIPGKVYVETAAQNTTLGLTKHVFVYSNGTPGVATVTVSAGDLLLEKFSS
jgi:hypothetical protein